MRTPIVGLDFTNKIVNNIFEGYYQNCKFDDTTFKDCTIDAVLKDCTVGKIILQNVKIERFWTPGTELPEVEIIKPSFQPLHLMKVYTKLFHNHQYITGKIRRYAKEHYTGTVLTRLLRGADYIDAHPELSWADFLFKTQVPKAMWFTAEEVFADHPELLEFSREIRRKRWES